MSEARKIEAEIEEEAQEGKTEVEFELAQLLINRVDSEQVTTAKVGKPPEGRLSEDTRDFVHIVDMDDKFVIVVDDYSGYVETAFVVYDSGQAVEVFVREVESIVDEFEEAGVSGDWRVETDIGAETCIDHLDFGGDAR